MPAKKAFSTYESYRKRLPQLKRTENHAQKIQSILDIAADFDTFLFDAFGVLNVGNQAINGAQQVIKTLMAAGKQCFVVSNAAGFEKERQVTKFKNLGFPFKEEQIITSRDALLENLINHDKNITWGSISPADGQSDIEKMGIKTINQDDSNFLDADAFLFLFSLNWDQDKQEKWIRALKQNPRPILLGNPDIIAPQGDRVSIESGHYIFSLENDLFERVQLFGKPYPSIYETVRRRASKNQHSFNPERTLMVGDTLHTDILGGNAFGIRTALITDHGFFKGLNYQEFIDHAEIYPDYILPSI